MFGVEVTRWRGAFPPRIESKFGLEAPPPETTTSFDNHTHGVSTAVMLGVEGDPRVTHISISNLRKMIHQSKTCPPKKHITTTHQRAVRFLDGIESGIN